MGKKTKKDIYMICNKADEKKCKGCGHEIIHKYDNTEGCSEFGCYNQPKCKCIPAPIEKLAVWRLTK